MTEKEIIGSSMRQMHRLLEMEEYDTFCLCHMYVENLLPQVQRH